MTARILVLKSTGGLPVGFFSQGGGTLSTAFSAALRRASRLIASKAQHLREKENFTPTGKLIYF
jgi:hypothetical protein